MLCCTEARLDSISAEDYSDTVSAAGRLWWCGLCVPAHLSSSHVACFAVQHDDPWKVRILPRVAFGVRPISGDATLQPDTPGVVVLHHFMSSWQASRRRRLIQALVGPLLSWSRWVGGMLVRLRPQ